MSSSANLTHAIHTGDLVAAREAICHGAPLADVVHPPLLEAVATGNPDMVRLLIAAGAPPMAAAARQAAQGRVDQALGFPDQLPETGPGSEEALLECLELADGLGNDPPSVLRRRRRAFVVAFFHKPGMRVSALHRIVEAITGMKIAIPTVSNDLRRAGLN